MEVEELVKGNISATIRMLAHSMPTSGGERGRRRWDLIV